MLSVPVLNFQFTECDEVVHDGIIHVIPSQDSDKHDVSGCKCGVKEVKVGDALIAVVHTAWDKRDLIEELYFTDSYTDANVLRKEYMEAARDLLRKGKCTNKQYWDRWLCFESVFQDIFQAN